MLIVLTSRIPESTDENYRVIHSLPQTTHLVLDRLSRSDVEQLLQSELDIQQIPEVLAETIYRKADGNPLFTEQLIMVIRDRLKEASANGSPPTRFDDLDTKALEFPDTLHGLITGRIDRLPPSPQLTIKVASVIGRRFSYCNRV
jgi:predicted ATPase